MATKIQAAGIAMESGGMAIIANGTKPGVLRRIFDGETEGTLFVSKLMSETRQQAEKARQAYLKLSTNADRTQILKDLAAGNSRPVRRRSSPQTRRTWKPRREQFAAALQAARDQ